jgi:autotransporter-associated beta strand protein
VFSGTGSIAGAASLTKSGIGSLTISNANSYTGGTVVNAGMLIVASAGALGSGNVAIHTGAILQLSPGLASAVVMPGVSLDGSSGAWAGTLDLTNNKLVVEDAANHAATFGRLQDQAIFGATHSTGILSSALPANTGIAVIDNAAMGTPFAVFGGVPVDAGSILIAPELLGDANADGHVDLTDLSVVLNNFGASTLNWMSGNFGGSGTVDLTDLSDVLNNFGLSYANANMGTAGGAVEVGAAPEPAAISVLMLGCGILSVRRRQVMG